MKKDDSGLSGMLMGIIRPYVPKIIERFLPMLNDELVKVLYQSDTERVDDEVQSTIMLFRDGKDDVYFTVSKLSEDDKVLRMSRPVLLKEYLAAIINENIKSM